jgi:drug/metabolite transporter (DMT)-like permease
MFITNWVMMAIFAFLWLLPAEHDATAMNVAHAAITGFLFFIGQIFTFLALNRGDVSVATPVLGSKVIFVALFSALLGVSALTPAIWFAVLLTAAATALLGGGGHKAEPGAMLRSLIYGFSAATSFALTDVLQQRWVKLWGFNHYDPTMFAFVGLFSLAFIPLFKGTLGELSSATWRWAVAGGVMLSLQALGIAWSIVYIGATTTNVLYNSRGMWSVVLVWCIGHWFANAERSHGRAIMLRRLAGSALLLAAIVLITQGHTA